MDEAELIRQSRYLLGMSVNDLAIALGLVRNTNVRRWENGRQQVSGPALVAIRYMLRDAGHRALEQLLGAAITERQRNFIAHEPRA